MPADSGGIELGATGVNSAGRLMSYQYGLAVSSPVSDWPPESWAYCGCILAKPASSGEDLPLYQDEPGISRR
ncbi:MAG TPA: hypothetical protein VF772_20845, partial [Terriglobales bacterium]